MAVVLNSEENRFFSSQLRRSHSQPKFISSQTSYTNSSFCSKRSSSFRTLINLPASQPSSSAASPRRISSGILSYSPSLGDILPDVRCETTEEENHQIIFPSYDDVDYYGNSEELDSPISPRNEESYTVSPADLPTTSSTANSSSIDVPRLRSANLVEHAGDDIAIRVKPSRHVDYLSHEWQEEDIWSSWKYISKHKADKNSARLENASWRTWIKEKNKLKTFPPEKLNWLKDCDVTWLYGPLQTDSDQSNAPSISPASGTITSTNCYPFKKPILKKRTMSEIMLQKSISSSSLLKQAAAAIHAQQSHKRGEHIQPVCSPSTFLYAFPTRKSSRLNPSYISSASSTKLTSPANGEKKRIHFNEQVEQCIAVDVKGDDDDDESYPFINYNDSDSEDDGIMMKRSTSKRKFPPLMARKKTRPSPSQDSKTIAMLPSTTLKYKSSTPETPPCLSKKYCSDIWNGTLLSSSPSFETLRPSKSSSRMLLGDDDDDIDWYPSSDFLGRRDSVDVAQERLSDSSSPIHLHKTNESEQVGLRRNNSMVFLSDEGGGGNDVASDGIFDIRRK